MKLLEDKYKGITIDHSTLPDDENEFKKRLLTILDNTKDKKLLWIKIPIERSHFIPILTNEGFKFHHCNEDDLMLVKKLIIKPIIPTAKNHTLGVGAVVIEKNKLLTIKDRFQKGYKLPGGHIDDKENITDALIREVLEETGIKVEFESILNLGHFTNSQFGESNLYVVCTAKALSKEINIIDNSEILEAKWMDIDEFLNHEDTNPYNKKLVQSAVKNSHLKLTAHDMQLRTPSGYELFF